jgi:hypothetical protein
MLSLNSSAERSVPFSLDGVEESQAPVVDERVMRRWSSGLEVDKMESSCCLWFVSCWVDAFRLASRMLIRWVVEQKGDPSIRDDCRRDVPDLEVEWHVSPV